MIYSILSFGLVTEDYQAVNVSRKNENWRFQGNIRDVYGCDIRFKTYLFGQGLVHLRESTWGCAVQFHYITKQRNIHLFQARSGLPQMALSGKFAVNTFETCIGAFPNGTMS